MKFKYSNIARIYLELLSDLDYFISLAILIILQRRGSLASLSIFISDALFWLLSSIGVRSIISSGKLQVKSIQNHRFKYVLAISLCLCSRNSSLILIAVKNVIIISEMKQMSNVKSMIRVITVVSSKKLTRRGTYTADTISRNAIKMSHRYLYLWSGWIIHFAFTMSLLLTYNFSYCAFGKLPINLIFIY